MEYFDDLTVTHAREIINCPTHMRGHCPTMWSLEFVVSGEIYYQIDEKPEIVIAGPAVHWHHPDHCYCYGPTEKNNWQHLYTTFTGERGRRISDEGLMPLSADCWMPVISAIEFEQTFREYLFHAHEIGPLHRGHCVVLLEKLLLILQDDYRQMFQKANPIRQTDLQTILHEIRLAPTEEYDADNLATRLHLSASHFRRCFHRAVGMPLHQYVISCRLNLAADLLHQTDRQIKEIGIACGYPDPVRFTKAFSKQFGLNPRDYRLTISG